MIGLRGNVDADYLNYLSMYEKVPTFSDGITLDAYSDIHGEVLYLFLNTLFKSLGLDFSALLIAVVTCSIFLKIYVISKYVININLVLALYFSFAYFLVEFIQIRWGLAISFTILSILFLEKSKYALSILFCIIAGLIQSLSLIIFPFLILYPVLKGRLAGNKLFFVIIIFFLPSILFVLNMVTGGEAIFDLVFKLYPPAIKVITTSKYYQAGGASTTLVLYYLVQYFSSMIVIYLSSIDRKNLSNKSDTLLAIYFLAYISSLQFLFLFSSIISQRINGLLVLVLSIVLIRSFEISKDKLYYVALYLCMFMLNFYMTYNNVFKPGALGDYYFSFN